MTLALGPATGATGKKPSGSPGHGPAPTSAHGGPKHDGGGPKHDGGGPKHDGGGPKQTSDGKDGPTSQSTSPRESTTSTGDSGKGSGSKGHGSKKGGKGGSSGTDGSGGSSSATPTPAKSSGSGTAGVTETATTAAATPTGTTEQRRSARRRRRASDARERRERRARGRDAGRSDTGARDPRVPGRSEGGTPATTAVPGQPQGASGPDGESGEAGENGREQAPTVVRTLDRVVEVIPTFLKIVIGVLGFLLLVASIAWGFLARTARFLRRQRETLLGEIGVLQGALLPNVPPELNRLEASVAYRPAEGLAAGGDFYDAFPLDGGRVGIVVGDVAGHGKEALMHTALLRYTMRAYLEADLEPRTALQVAGRSLDRGFDTLATVVLAVYDPRRHVLQYATAGHPPPVFLGEADHVPVTQASSPPIGAGLSTGLRQTTVSLSAGSAVCFFTDGLIEARREDELIGRLGLVDIIRELGPHATATELLDRVAAQANEVSDDMAACMFRVSDGPATVRSPRVEEIEVEEGERLDTTLARFLVACGVDEDEISDRLDAARRTIRQFGGAVVSVAMLPDRPVVDVNPANVESIAWAYSKHAVA